MSLVTFCFMLGGALGTGLGSKLIAATSLDRLYLESAQRPKVMGIAFHPYLSGVPHQVAYFEALLEYLAGHPGVAFWTGERILEWYRSGGARGEGAARPPGSARR